MSLHPRPNTSHAYWRLWSALALIVVPFLGLIGMQGYEALSRLPRAALGQNLAAHSFQVILTAQSLRSALQDAERGQRGYLLTGRSAYLTPYKNGIVSAPRLLSRLMHLTSDDPEQQRQLPGLAEQLGLKLRELQRTIDAYRSGGRRAAERIVRTNAGLRETQSIEDTIAAITDTENRLLSRRLRKLAAQDQSLQRIAMASTLLAAILMMAGLVMAVLVLRNSRRLQWEVSRHAEDVAEVNRELQQRNIELAQATELARAAQQEARQAERTKGRFLATASHDLRQPLQAVSLLNGALRRSVHEPIASEALRQQEEAIAAMTRLLNALLDISKLESGAVKPEPTAFAVSALLAGLAREFRGVAASKGLQFHLEPCEAWAHSDPSLVEQILRNLVSNAIKYTREGCVRLRAMTDPPWINLQVIDSGVGISEDQIRLIGEEFYQIGVPSNSTRDGYGLGLSIVRRLVQLLDLQFDVHSELGKGSTFSLRLRQGARPEAATRLQPAATPFRAAPATAARILLVEDDPEVRTATGMLLRAEGYGVTAAASSTEALQMAREDRSIALVVTDFHLGVGETGVQVVLRLREILRSPLKAILITGDTSSAIKQLPPDPDLRVLSKPVPAEQFLGLIRELLTA